MIAKPVPKVTDMNRLYFEGCAKGELRLRRCRTCQALFRFAHEWCPKCWSLELDWVRASGAGKVTHYSIVYQPPSEAFETPYVIALIQLEERVRMLSNLKCDPAQVRIGMPVQVTFEQRGEVCLPMFTPQTLTKTCPCPCPCPISFGHRPACDRERARARARAGASSSYGLGDVEGGSRDVS